MDTHDHVEFEMKEMASIRVEKPAPTAKGSVCMWLRLIVTLDDASNQKRHRPLFIIVMCVIHISIHLTTYINMEWRGRNLTFTLHDLFKFFVPCMRPTPDNIRTRIVSCNHLMKNATCYYDDELKGMCFHFMYPYQLWRTVTVNLFHINWLHLSSNLLKQLLYGIPLERKYGSVRVAVIYWLSELGASLSCMLKNREIGKKQRIFRFPSLERAFL